MGHDSSESGCTYGDVRTLCTSIQDVYDPCPAVSKMLSKNTTKNNVGPSYRKFVVGPFGPVIVFDNNLSSGIRARGIVGFLSQPIKKQLRIFNSFSDSLFGINLVHSASSESAPDRIHMDMLSSR